jgi:quinol monooxygenase YgiN
MSRFVLFTFNPHPSDTKEFVQVMTSLLQPILQKQKQFIFVREKKGRPEEHIHLLFTGEYKDKDKIKQKIENKSIKSFISTQIKTSNSDYNHAFDYLLIPQKQEDHMYYVGYVCKEEDCCPNTKGFSQEYITDCIKYYHTVERNKSQKIDNSWKHLRPNELHCYMEHYSEKLGISVADPNLVPLMKQDKISFNQITMRQMSITKDELVLAHKDQVDENIYKSAIKSSQNETEDNFYWKLQFLSFLESLKELDEYDDDQVMGKLKLMYYEAQNKIGGL